MDRNDIPQEINDEGRPPVFSSWNRVYAAVLLNLAVLIVMFYLFSKMFD